MYWYKSFICTCVTMYLHMSLCMHLCIHVIPCVYVCMIWYTCYYVCFFVFRCVPLCVQVITCVYMCNTVYTYHPFIIINTYGGICIFTSPFQKTSVKFCERLFNIFYYSFFPVSPLYWGSLFYWQ